MYLVYPVSSVQVSGISYIPKALVQDVDPDFRKLVSSFMGYPKGRAIFTSGKTTLRKALATKELLAALAKHAASFAKTILAIDPQLFAVDVAEFDKLVKELVFLSDSYRELTKGGLVEFAWDLSDIRLKSPLHALNNKVFSSTKDLLRPALRKETAVNDLTAWQASNIEAIRRSWVMHKSQISAASLGGITLANEVLTANKQMAETVAWLAKAATLALDGDHSEQECSELLKTVNTAFPKYAIEDGEWTQAAVEFKTGGAVLGRALKIDVDGGSSADGQPSTASLHHHPYLLAKMMHHPVVA